MPESPVDVALSVLTPPRDPEAAEAWRLLRLGHNVVLYGPPGTGKSHAAFEVAQAWETQYGSDSVFTTTFHPSYSYEDFVEGFRPVEDDPGTFSLQDGILLEACKSAETTDTLLLIDEINRADVARVFGELITYIERDKRNVQFRTAQKPGREIVVPSRLFILGTMNTADKSVSLLDVALRRRFKFVECPPLPDAFTRIDTWRQRIFGIEMGTLLELINERLLGQGVGRDRLVGHSILAVAETESEAVIFDRFRYDLVPLLEEYLFGDPQRMQAVLPGLIDERGSLMSSALNEGYLRQFVAPDPEAPDGPGPVTDNQEDPETVSG